MNKLEPNDRVNDLAHRVIGAAIEVHREIGPGYAESVYENAMRLELESRGIPFQCQSYFSVKYKGVNVGEGRIDMLVDDCLIVEFKTVDRLMPIHTAQALSYLKAFGFPLALLLNFKVHRLMDGMKRVVLSQT